MSTDTERTRCRERIERLASGERDVGAMQRGIVTELQRVVGFDRWCWPASDPLTLLPGPGLAEHDYGPALPRALEQEYSGSDLATKMQAALGTSPVVSLSDASGQDLYRSPRWDEVLRPAGIGDLAVLACRDGFGTWGWVEVYRDHVDRPFSGQELRLLAALGPALGTALRRGVTKGAPGPDWQVADVGVLLLGPDLGLVWQTAAALAWVAALPAAELFAGWHILPPAVYAAAALVRCGGTDVHMLERSAAGGWVRISASPVAETRDIAVTIRAASPSESSDVVARAYGLTERERRIAALLATGLDTEGIAQTLVISPWTVQDHLKSVFAKVGVRSRGEVTARLRGER